MEQRAGPLISFYGDDFTGSTDALEVLTRAGLKAALFMDLEGLDDAERIAGLEAVGVAGNTRSLPTEEMEGVLRRVFRRLRELAAPVVHYKICSTFDSSPEVGSIGRVLETGAEAFPGRPIPLLVGAPFLARYCVFGNLFARSGLDSQPFRLDRHPTMRCHPVTPMTESDLRVHLAAQTDGAVALLDVLDLGAGDEHAVRRYRELAGDEPLAILIDVLTDEHLDVAGEVIWAAAGCGERGAERVAGQLVVGSSGADVALAAAWRRRGLIGEALEFPHPDRVEQLLVLSGSCSPVTCDQLHEAFGVGFGNVALETDALVGERTESSAEQRAIEAAVRALAAGRSVVVHTALGPGDARIAATRRRVAAPGAAGRTEQTALCGRRLGRALGRVGRRILERAALRRVLVTGGDTSWHVAKTLGVESLEMAAPMAPGSPLCRAHAPDSPADGLEVLFKGGQVGKRDLIVKTLEGQP